jgi:hypothetical protein
VNGHRQLHKVKTRPPETLCVDPARSAPRAPDSGPREGRPAWWRVEHRPCGRGTALALASAATCGQAQSRGQSSSPTQRRGQARTMSAWGRDSVGTRWGPTPASVKRDPGHGIAQGTWRLVRRRRGRLRRPRARHRWRAVSRRNHLHPYKGADPARTVSVTAGEKLGSF